MSCFFSGWQGHYCSCFQSSFYGIYCNICSDLKSRIGCCSLYQQHKQSYGELSLSMQTMSILQPCCLDWSFVVVLEFFFCQITVGRSTCWVWPSRQSVDIFLSKVLSIHHIHNYTEYNEEWNVFSAFNPSKCTHTRSSGQPTQRRPGSSCGFGALLKGLTSVVENSCRSQDSIPQPWVTSPTLYPLELLLPSLYYMI